MPLEQECGPPKLYRADIQTGRKKAATKELLCMNSSPRQFEHVNFDRWISDRRKCLFQYLRDVDVPSGLFVFCQSIPASGPMYFRHSLFEATKSNDKLRYCLLVRLFHPPIIRDVRFAGNLGNVPVQPGSSISRALSSNSSARLYTYGCHTRTGRASFLSVPRFCSERLSQIFVFPHPQILIQRLTEA